MVGMPFLGMAWQHGCTSNMHGSLAWHGMAWQPSSCAQTLCSCHLACITNILKSRHTTSNKYNPTQNMAHGRLNWVGGLDWVVVVVTVESVSHSGSRLKQISAFAPFLPFKKENLAMLCPLPLHGLHLPFYVPSNITTRTRHTPSFHHTLHMSDRHDLVAVTGRWKKRQGRWKAGGGVSSLHSLPPGPCPFFSLPPHLSLLPPFPPPRMPHHCALLR